MKLRRDTHTSRILDLFVVRNFKLIPVFLYSVNFFTVAKRMDYIKYYPTTFSQIYVGVNILWHLRRSNFFTRLKDVVFDFFPVSFILNWNYINANKIAKNKNSCPKMKRYICIFYLFQMNKTVNKNKYLV